MIVTVAYLQPDKISGILSYRRKFPKDLVRFIARADGKGLGRKELKVGLRVRGLNEPQGMDRYRAAHAEYGAIVKDAERARAAEQKRLSGTFDPIDARTIAYLASLMVSDGLSMDDDVRLLREPSERKRQRAATIAETSTDDLAECRELRAIGDVEAIVGMWGDVAESLAEMEGLCLDREAPSFIALCSAVNDAAIATWEALLSRLNGNLVPTPPLAEAPKQRNDVKGAQERVGLLDLFERYAEAPDRHPKTIAQWRPYIRHLVEFIGTDDVYAVTHDDLVRWRNFLRDEHTYRGKRLSSKTINDSYLAAAQVLFSWAKGDGIIPHNPMKEVAKVRLPRKPKTRGSAFTAEEAATILKATLELSASQESEYLRNVKRWCPWLMAYSGARVNEITQLRKEDIYEVEGIIVMRLTPDAGTIKTDQYRLVPLHSHILAQGFVDWVNARRDGPLFYDPERRRSEHAINRQPNRQGSKLAEWVGSLGIKGVKPNHGWRHLFISRAPRFQMDPGTTRVITGHSGPDVHENTYQEGYVDVMAREIEKMPRFFEIEGEPSAATG